MLARTVTLVGGQTRTFEPVTLIVDRGTIIGTVELADGKPAEGVAVSVASRYSTVATPDSSGKGLFRIDRVPVGTSYQVTARKDRYALASAGNVAVKARSTPTPSPSPSAGTSAPARCRPAPRPRR